MKYLYGVLFLIASLIWLVVVSQPDSKLHLIACDVGQGDAILVVYKNIQILTDGGPPNGKVISCLSKHMPFWDREVELIILTHPQLDHFGGLIEVFKRYKVDNFLASSVDNSGSKEYGVLKKLVTGNGVKVMNPTSGMVIRYDLIYLDIVNPLDELLSEGSSDVDQNILGAYTTKRDLNDYSVVANLRLGNFSALLTGDIGPEMEKELLAKNLIKPVNYIKIPHHGSKNGIIPEVLDIARPSLAVISVGKKNSYGHPNKEVLELLKERGVKTLRTDELGNIEVVTDGKTYFLK